MPKSESNPHLTGRRGTPDFLPRPPGWLWLIPMVLTTLVYAPAFWGDLVWDDIRLVNVQLDYFITLGDALKPSHDYALSGVYYYRPVTFLSFMLDRALSESGSAFFYHLSNVIYHVITTLFVWLLARRLFNGRPNGELGAIVASIVFGLHPIHTESVSWISGRTDVLAAMLMIPSILLPLYWRDRLSVWALFAGAGLFFLALLAKEVAIAALLLVPAAMLLTRRAPERRKSRALVWIGLGLAYLAATWLYFELRTTAGSIEFGASSLTLGAQLESLVRSAAYYVLKILIPWPQTNIVGATMVPGLLWSSAIVAVVFGLLAVAVRRSFRGDGVLLFCLLWFGVTLAPALFVATRPLAAASVAERYLYVPSVGFALLLGLLFSHFMATKWQKLAIGTLAGLALVLASSTIARGFVWQTSFNLWSDAVKKSPELSVPWENLGTVYSENGDQTTAVKLLLRALEGEEVWHSHARINANLGTIYAKQGELGKAQKYFQASLSIRPEWPIAHWHLGNLYKLRMQEAQATGDSKTQRDDYFRQSLEYYATSVEYDPTLRGARWELIDLYSQYGQILEGEGDSTDAKRQYRNALKQIHEIVVNDPAAGSMPRVQMTRNQLIMKLGITNY